MQIERGCYKSGRSKNKNLMNEIHYGSSALINYFNESIPSSSELKGHEAKPKEERPELVVL